MAATATPAVHALRKHGLAFTEHEYRYEERGGTRCRRATGRTRA